MIIDHICNKNNYYQYPWLYKILSELEVITKNGFDKAVDSCVHCNSASLITSSTKLCENFVFESHTLHIDIHYILEGIEGIAIADVRNLFKISENDREKDVIFFRYMNASDITKTFLSQGMFIVCFPSDAHCPGIMLEKPTTVKKIVIKDKI